VGRRRQGEIYMAGLAGKKPRVPFGFDRLEEEAERVMSPQAFAYVAGGAGNESTVRANR
jgi:lactate 2-monooxygenase